MPAPAIALASPLFLVCQRCPRRQSRRVETAATSSDSSSHSSPLPANPSAPPTSWPTPACISKSRTPLMTAVQQPSSRSVSTAAALSLHHSADDHSTLPLHLHDPHCPPLLPPKMPVSAHHSVRAVYCHPLPPASCAAAPPPADAHPARARAPAAARLRAGRRVPSRRATGRARAERRLCARRQAALSA